MSGDEIQRSRYKLFFDVQRSVRYHTKRWQFFDRIGMLIKVFTTVGGLGTFTTLLAKGGEGWVLVYGLLAGVSSIVDLVIGTDKKARLHADLCAEFIALQREMVLADEDISDNAYRSFYARRLEIEAKEPPVLHVLNAICHNELLRATGHEASRQVKINRLQRVLAPFFDWCGNSIQPQHES